MNHAVTLDLSSKRTFYMKCFLLILFKLPYKKRRVIDLRAAYILLSVRFIQWVQAQSGTGCKSLALLSHVSLPQVVRLLLRCCRCFSRRRSWLCICRQDRG